jgi:hypothetical protein
MNLHPDFVEISKSLLSNITLLLVDAGTAA